MKVELAEMQQKMAASSHGSAGAPAEHKEQAGAKAEAKVEKSIAADVEAAVSVITEALQPLQN